MLLWACIWSLWSVLLSRRQNEDNTPISNTQRRSVFIWRSFCPHCKNTLTRYMLLPIISFLWLWWKCWFCKKSIDPRYVWLEIACTLSTIACYLWLAQWWYIDQIVFRESYIFWIWLAIHWLLILLVFWDIRTQYLHDSIYIAFSVCALILALFFSPLWWQSHFIFAISTIALFLIFYVWWRRYAQSKWWEEGMWFGDVLLAWSIWLILPFVIDTTVYAFSPINIISILSLYLLSTGMLWLSTVGITYIINTIRWRKQSTAEVAFFPAMVWWFLLLLYFWYIIFPYTLLIL